MGFDKWTEVQLKDIATINMGQSPKSEFYNEESGVPFLQGTRTFKHLYPKIDTYTTRVTKMANEGDLLFSVRAPVGDINFAPVDLCIGRGLASLKSKVGNQQFLYYLLEANKHTFESQSTGTIFSSINKKTLENLKFLVPDEVSQKKIGSFLWSLDRKVENNNNIIIKLEQLAQTLFKRWFVDFEFPNENGEPYKSSGGEMVDSELGVIPTGWETTPLYEIADYINGTSFKSKDLDSVGLPVIKIAELKNGVTNQTRFYNKNDKDLKYIINNKDILFSWSGNPETSIDTFIWYRNKGLLNQHIFKVIANKPFSESFVYVLLKYMKPVFTNTAADKQTTGLGHVTKGDLKRLKVPKPNEDILYQFEILIRPIIESIYMYSRESISLSENRDTLLPKLLSGEVEL